MRFYYARMLDTRQWTGLRVLSTPDVYVGRKNAALERVSTRASNILAEDGKGIGRGPNIPCNCSHNIARTALEALWLGKKVCPHI